MMKLSVDQQFPRNDGPPQESKLNTYLNPVTSTRSLNQAMGNLNIEASPTSSTAPMPMAMTSHVLRQPQLSPYPWPPPIMTHIPPPHLPPQPWPAHPPPQMLIGEFVPINYYTHTPSHALIQESPQNSPPAPMPMPMPVTQVHQENVGGTTYFYSTNADSLNASAVMNTPAQMGLAQAFYLPETIREDFYPRAQDVFLQHDPLSFPADALDPAHDYTCLVPLESTGPHALATSYRGTHRRHAIYVALRRMHECIAAAAPDRLAKWTHINDPNIVRFQDCYPTDIFRDHSLMLVYDYHPACNSILNKYIRGADGDVNVFMDPFSSDPDAPIPYTYQNNAVLRARASGQLLPEAMLWSILVQLTSALRTIHSHGLACRTLDPSKVIVNGCRVRISWPGIADAMHNESYDSVQAQQKDLVALGRLVLSLACRNRHCDNINAYIDFVGRTYSIVLKNIIKFLLTPNPHHRRTIADVVPLIAERFFIQTEHGYELISEWQPFYDQAISEAYCPLRDPRWTPVAASSSCCNSFEQFGRPQLQGGINVSGRKECLGGFICGIETLFGERPRGDGRSYWHVAPGIIG